MVRVGSARSNEHGGITSGKPGDQKGGAEVSMQAWYLHSKGWSVIRAKDPTAREKIATNMEAGCRNNHIGIVRPIERPRRLLLSLLVMIYQKSQKRWRQTALNL